MAVAAAQVLPRAVAAAGEEARPWRRVEGEEEGVRPWRGEGRWGEAGVRPGCLEMAGMMWGEGEEGPGGAQTWCLKT